MSKTKRVRPNSLGLERINRHRRIRGLAEIQATIAPLGEESQSAPPAGSPSGMELSSDGTSVSSSGSLPLAVDNTTLPSFPPVRHQGSPLSCAAFSTTYYVGTHMLGLARGFNNKNNADNSLKLSPKWTYNLANGGANTGTWFTTNMDVMMKLGCPSWADFPYAGSQDPSSNYLEWSRDPAVWRTAISNRFQQIGRVQAVDTASGLENLKALLANGYALLLATDILGWKYTGISDDPSTDADNGLVGRKACWMVESHDSGHAMTIAGYNDHIWVDINKNGRVDSGEKGALKIVNSWGNTWNGDTVNGDGTVWIAYDALKQTSAVAGAVTPWRASGYRSAFWGSEVYWISARASYTPTLLAQFTISHAKRNQLNLRVGSSSTSVTTPQNLFPTDTVFGWPNSGWSQAFKFLGGEWAFDGTSSPVSATMVMDLTDLAQTGSRRYYLSVQDAASGFPASLSDFRLTTPTGAVLATATTGIPGSADNSTALAYVDYATGAIPVITSASTASATVGLPIPTFTVTATNNPSGFGATGLPPGLSIHPVSGAITGTPSQAGSYTVSLSASNANGVGTASMTFNISTQQIAPPAITSSLSVSGTTGQAFNYTITASNSPTGYGASGLPPGLSVNPANGAVTGTPTQPGNFSAIITASNAGGTGSRSLSITIATASVPVPLITSFNTAGGLSGSSFTYRIQATNNPTSFGATNLPSGLSVNPATGIISGTLPGAAQYFITLVASNSSGSGYLQLTLTVAGNNIYGPANDGFNSPMLFNGISATSNGNNVDSSAQTGEPAHAGNTASRSVWWRWTAPNSGPVTIQTGGSSFDTVLAVYTGSSVNALTTVASNDDALAGGASQVTFNASIGTTYQIAVDGYSGATGQIALGLQLTPTAGVVNDHFANRSLITGSSANLSGGNEGATSESGEPAHAGYTARRSVWWTWTAPSGGTLTLDTIGSDFDTLLGVYTGSSVNSLTLVAGNDDGGGNGTSKVTITVTAGTAYQIAVDGWQGATGGIRLNLSFQSNSGGPVNDMFANRTTMTGTSSVLAGSSSNATAETNEPSHNGYSARRSVWWTWTAPTSGAVTINTEGSGFDTILAIYTGSSVSSLTMVASDDDTGAGTTSSVAFAAVAGRNYQIAVDGYSGASGSITLRMNLQVRPANDDFVNRITLAGGNTGDSGSNINATAETSEPNHDGRTPRSSVWWTWTAPGSGIVTIITDGSNFDTVLAVYRGTSLTGLVPVVANDDHDGQRTSSVTFHAVAGTAYQITVDGYSGAQGVIELGIGQTASSVLYSTDFTNFPTGLGALDGFDGWIATDEGSTGSYGVFSYRGSQAAWVGYNATSSSRVYVYRPMGYDPVAMGTPVIRFGVDVTIEDSDNGHYDKFEFSIFNVNDDFLAAVQFDNSIMQIRYNNAGSTLLDTGRSFVNGRTYRLELTMNFATNRWSGNLDGTALFTNQVMHAGGRALTLGDVDAVWSIRNTGTPGDNFMVFDNYRIETDSPSSTRVISLDGNLSFGQVAVGSSAQRAMTISNTGNSALNVSTINYPSGFSGDWPGGTIPANGSAVVNVTFSPSNPQSYGGTITVVSDATSGNSGISVNATGIGAPEIAVEQPPGTNLIDGTSVVDCGNSYVNIAAAPKTFTIRNTGTADLNGIAIIGNTGDFIISGPSTSTLAPGLSTTFTVTFKPTATGTRGATLHIASNDADENPFDIAITGMGAVYDPFRIALDGPFFEPRVGNQLTLFLTRLANQGETIKLVGKLPTGLKLNVITGVVSGIISGTPGSYPLTVQFLQGKTVVRTVSLPLTIQPYPSTLLGSFEGLLEDDEGLPTGVIRLSITKPNAWSATMESAGASRRSAKGSFLLDQQTDTVTITANFAASKTVPAESVTMALDADSPLFGGGHTGATLRGFRIASGAERPPVTIAYSFAMFSGLPDEINVPAGFGWMTGKVSNLGVGIFKGMLGDGTTASLTLRVSASGQAVLWAQPYKNRNSYIGGIVTLGNLGQPVSDNPTLADEVWWYKAADGSTLSYPNGFPAMPVVVGTGKWIAPATATALGASLGWRDNRTAEVIIEGGGLSNQEPQTTSAALPTEFTLDDKFNLAASAPVTSPLVAWKGKVAKTNGAFSGTLTLPAGFSANIPSGSAAVSGVLIQDGSWGSITGCGLIKVPASGAKGSFRTAAILLDQ